MKKKTGRTNELFATVPFCLLFLNLSAYFGKDMQPCSGLLRLTIYIVLEMDVFMIGGQYLRSMFGNMRKLLKRAGLLQILSLLVSVDLFMHAKKGRTSMAECLKQNRQYAKVLGSKWQLVMQLLLHQLLEFKSILQMVTPLLFLAYIFLHKLHKRRVMISSYGSESLRKYFRVSSKVSNALSLTMCICLCNYLDSTALFPLPSFCQCRFVRCLIISPMKDGKKGELSFLIVIIKFYFDGQLSRSLV